MRMRATSRRVENLKLASRSSFALWIGGPATISRLVALRRAIEQVLRLHLADLPRVDPM